MYSIIYTPFIWGARDLDKSVDIWKRINPAVGVTFEDVSENILVGFTVDFPSNVTVTFGKHFRRVERISPSSGLTVGSVHSGSIPTSKSWEDGNFISLGFDLRAVKTLFGMGSPN